MNSIAVACTVVLGLLLFVLGLAVSLLRTRTGVLNSIASESDPLLTKLVRAHGNTAEYAPLFAVLFLYFGARHPSHWQLGCMVGATACRLLLVVGLIAWPSMSKPNPARAVGALGTYAFGTCLCLAMLGGR